MRRVVVTGLGLVTPLGADVETAWANIIAGKSGAATITRFDPADQKCTIACEVKPADHPYGFDPGKRVDHKVQRQVDPPLDLVGLARLARLRGRGRSPVWDRQQLELGVGGLFVHRDTIARATGCRGRRL